MKTFDEIKNEIIKDRLEGIERKQAQLLSHERNESDKEIDKKWVQHKFDVE